MSRITLEKTYIEIYIYISEIYIYQKCVYEILIQLSIRLYIKKLYFQEYMYSTTDSKSDTF
jgi:hypothetical protein